MNVSKFNSLLALVAGCAGVVGMTYEKEIQAFIRVHPAITMGLGFLLVIYNNLVKPIHK